MSLLICETLFGRERAAEIQELVERLAGGKPCPCKVGHECPMLAAADVENDVPDRAVS